MLFELRSVIYCEYSISIVRVTYATDFEHSLVNIGTHLCKHCCQSMTLAHLTSKNRNSISIFRIHLRDRFFYFFTLHCNNFSFTAYTVKISILLLYNLSMRYRLSLLSTQSAQPFFLISARLNF